MMKLIFLLMLLLTISCGGSEGRASAAQPGVEVPTQTTTETVQVPEAPAQGTAAPQAAATPQPAQ